MGMMLKVKYHLSYLISARGRGIDALILHNTLVSSPLLRRKE